MTERTGTAPPIPAASRRVRELVYTGAARAYGYTVCTDHDDEPCGCGHLLGDHHTDARGCSYCGCRQEGS